MNALLNLNKLFLCAFFLGHWPLISAQNVPNVACPQYFEYLYFNNQYIGRIALPFDNRYTMNTVEVELVQRTRPVSNYYGKLSLFDSEDITKYNLANGLPIQYRVDFPTSNEVPKLTKITVNDREICRASSYSLPRTFLTLRHDLSQRTVPLRVDQGPRITPNLPSVIGVRPPPQNDVKPQREEEEISPSVSVSVSHMGISHSTSGGSGENLNDICGREAPTISPFIFKGSNVQRGKFPWLTAIFEKQSTGPNFFCGGTLVSRSTVVSAAHCFRLGRTLTADRTVVSMGRVSLDEYTDIVWRDVTTVLIHDQFTPDSFSDADIALLQLKQPVTFTELVKPICLWTQNYPLNLETGSKSYVAGWGADEHGNANTKVAKTTDADIVTESDCHRRLPVRQITSRTICTVNKEGAGPCTGDSGGGLMILNNNKWLLRGIISAGQQEADKCDHSKPVIYCDLAKHIDWIREHMWL